MEIAQLLESALANNRSGLRRAAMQTVTQMAGADPEITISAVLESDAGDAIRQLTLDDLREALATRREFSPARNAEPDETPQSREERIYRLILAALQPGPMTIGQLGKAIGVESDELRGYLAWMKRMGKVVSSGRARATRYAVA